MKLSVLMWLKNSGEYIDYLKETFQKLENHYADISFEFIFCENNSTDDTKKKLIDVQKVLKGESTLIMSNLINNKNFNNNISTERGIQVKNMRNRLKEMIGDLKSDYVIILDDDTYFNINILKNLLSKIEDEVDMVIANGIMFDILHEKNLYHHYDTLAFISSDNITYKKTGNSCLFKNCSRCFNKRKKFNITLDEKYLLDMNKDLIEINAGFGNFLLIKTKVFNKINWNNKNVNSVCEWHYFCRNITDNKGKIVISCKDKVLVCSKKYPYEKYKNIILKTLTEKSDFNN